MTRGLINTVTVIDRIRIVHTLAIHICNKKTATSRSCEAHVLSVSDLDVLLCAAALRPAHMLKAS